MNGTRIFQFSPWKLSMHQLGPFRDAIERVSFRHGSGEPSNLFLIMAGNGKGKTTALEAMCFLLRFLDAGFDGQEFGQTERELTEDSRALMQLDVILRTSSDAHPERRILLSLSWGDVGEGGISGWETSPLEEGVADYWLRLGFRRDTRTGVIERARFTHDESMGWEAGEEAENILANLREYVRHGDGELWTGVTEGAELSDRPTCLYFAATRDIVRTSDQRGEQRLGRPTVPRYRVSHRFDREGTEWSASLENLLVWYFWLSPSLFESARALVNNFVFERGKIIAESPQKDPPGVQVSVAGEKHGLDRLSSGERNLTQFVLRYGTHRTRNMIVLIDEVELHLHKEFRRRLMLMLKQEVAYNPGVTVVVTSHDSFMIDLFDESSDEENVRKTHHFFWS